jgi:hypothetical protein
VDTGYFVFGLASSSGAIEISGTDDDALYRTARYDSSVTGADLEFATPVSNGGYEVKLHFAEIFAGITAAGQRVFDVYAENQLVIAGLDIFDRVGLNAALVLSVPVNVTDGTLNLRFDHLGLQNPQVCAIEVHAVVPAVPLSFEEWLVLNNLAGQSTNDSDKGGLSNLDEFELQMDPNDPNDDLGFRLGIVAQGNSRMIALPELKPIGNYYIHRNSNLEDLGDGGNRIATITRAQIEAMSPAQRSSHMFEDTGGGARAFYRLYFEPVAE